MEYKKRMNTLIEQIKKGQEIFDKQFSEQGDVVQFLVTKYGTSIHHKAWLETFKSFHTAFLISLLEGERERWEKMMKTAGTYRENYISGIFRGDIINWNREDDDEKRDEYNAPFKERISHIDEALAFLKTNV